MHRAFNIITKPIGPRCNLNCTYCFYLEKENLYLETPDFRMPNDILETYIRDYIASQDVNEVFFSWQGGEPTLLGVPFFEQVVELQKKYANGKRIENSFQTNGVLLDDTWCDFLSAHNFLVGISVDGPESLHDIYRLDKGGKGTHRSVLRCVDILKKHNVDFNTLTVVQKTNSRFPLEVYRFLKDIGSAYMQFIPIVERTRINDRKSEIQLLSPDDNGAARVSDWSVEPIQYGEFLISVFDEWVRHDVGSVFVQLFDISLEAWVGMQPGLCIFREKCGKALALEHNGDLYSCDHYVFPENKLGNIMEDALTHLVYSDQQCDFGNSKQDELPEVCRACDVLFVCNGECPKHRFVKTPDGESNLNYLCPAYEKFFRYVDPYMKYMVNQLKTQKSPADVMAWSKEKDAGFPSVKPGVNDPCPCQSGLKYKKCCGTLP